VTGGREGSGLPTARLPGAAPDQLPAVDAAVVHREGPPQRRGQPGSRRRASTGDLSTGTSAVGHAARKRSRSRVVERVVTKSPPCPRWPRSPRAQDHVLRAHSRAPQGRAPRNGHRVEKTVKRPAVPVASHPVARMTGNAQRGVPGHPPVEPPRSPAAGTRELQSWFRFSRLPAITRPVEGASDRLLPELVLVPAPCVHLGSQVRSPAVLAELSTSFQKPTASRRHTRRRGRGLGHLGPDDRNASTSAWNCMSSSLKTMRRRP